MSFRNFVYLPAAALAVIGLAFAMRVSAISLY